MNKKIKIIITAILLVFGAVSLVEAQSVDFGISIGAGIPVFAKTKAEVPVVGDVWTKILDADNTHANVGVRVHYLLGGFGGVGLDTNFNILGLDDSDDVGLFASLLVDYRYDVNLSPIVIGFHGGVGVGISYYENEILSVKSSCESVGFSCGAGVNFGYAISETMSAGIAVDMRYAFGPVKLKSGKSSTTADKITFHIITIPIQAYFSIKF